MSSARDTRTKSSATGRRVPRIQKPDASVNGGPSLVCEFYDVNEGDNGAESDSSSGLNTEDDIEDSDTDPCPEEGSKHSPRKKKTVIDREPCQKRPRPTSRRGRPRREDSHKKVNPDVETKGTDNPLKLEPEITSALQNITSSVEKLNSRMDTMETDMQSLHDDIKEILKILKTKPKPHQQSPRMAKSLSAAVKCDDWKPPDPAERLSWCALANFKTTADWKPFKLLHLLPIWNLKALKKVEHHLGNINEMKSLIRFLASFGGEHRVKVARIIIRRILAKDVAMKFSGLGKKGKMNITALRIYRAIEAAICHLFPESTEVDVRRAVSHVLSGVRDWDGGRKHRLPLLNDMELIKQEEIIPSDGLERLVAQVLGEES